MLKFYTSRTASESMCVCVCVCVCSVLGLCDVGWGLAEHLLSFIQGQYWIDTFSGALYDTMRIDYCSEDQML